jgi:hypothetical protein
MFLRTSFGVDDEGRARKGSGYIVERNKEMTEKRTKRQMLRTNKMTDMIWSQWPL